jgi:COMPASS component SPP1
MASRAQASTCHLKKRSAPSAASTVKKKGTAKMITSNKKHNVEIKEGTTRFVTPTLRTFKSTLGKAMKKGSQAGTPAFRSSPAPHNSLQVHA